MNDSAPRKFAVVHCGQLVTLAGASRPRRGAAEMRELAVVEDGAMVIADGKIERTGTTDDLRATFAREKHLPVIDARGCVVTPGFVDAHTHMVFAVRAPRSSNSASQAKPTSRLQRPEGELPPRWVPLAARQRKNC